LANVEVVGPGGGGGGGGWGLAGAPIVDARLRDALACGGREVVVVVVVEEEDAVERSEKSEGRRISLLAALRELGSVEGSEGWRRV
jgi:hypothetical protein